MRQRGQQADEAAVFQMDSVVNLYFPGWFIIGNWGAKEVMAMFDDLVSAIIGWVGADSPHYSKKRIVVFSVLMGFVFFVTSVVREWLFYSDNPISFMDYMVLAVFTLGVSVAVLLILLFGRRVK